MKRMIWAARRVVLEGGRPAPWCGGQGHERRKDGGVEVGFPEGGVLLRASEFCAHLRAAERSFRTAFECRREGSAWLEATRKAVCMALLGGILIFSVLQRLTKFCAARRGAAMV